MLRPIHVMTLIRLVSQIQRPAAGLMTHTTWTPVVGYSLTLSHSKSI